MNPKTLILLGIVLCVLGPGQSSGAYEGNYTVSDVDDITIDILGITLVEIKGEIPPIVNLLVLVLIMGLMSTAITILLGIFLLWGRKERSQHIPKKKTRTKTRKKKN